AIAGLTETAGGVPPLAGDRPVTLRPW
ncbi:MAG: hypothetical protein QOH87_3931, partial [Trebonia sp.]|nr:hypothetical protein [Trebonia sp.]